MATFQDISITCGNCGAAFVFTAGEQEYYAQKNLHTPKRCKACREKRRKASAEQESTTLLPSFHTVAKSDIQTDAEHTLFIIGHSLSPVDWDYFRKVKNSCPDAHWYVSYYSENDLKSCQRLRTALGIREDNLSVFKAT